MSAICGIVNIADDIIPLELSSVMIDKLKSYEHDISDTWVAKNVFLGSIIKYDTPESTKERLPRENTSYGLVITADAIIDNRKELLKIFKIPEAEGNSTTDSQLILLSYLKWGEDCPKYLIGDFVFAIWNKKKKELFCARDQVGKRTFYYYFSSKLFAFSTAIKPLLHIGDNDKTLNELWIAEFLSLEEVIQEIECDNTIYNGIKQLLPAHTIKLNPNEIVTKKYWNPLDKPDLKLKNNEEYEEAFREVFSEAVRCRLRSLGSIGILLSGGLDSGSVACIAAGELQQEERRLKGFSSVPFSGYEDWLPQNRIADERKQIQVLADRYKNIDLNFCDSSGINAVNSIEKLLNIAEQPYKIVENFSWVNELSAKAAEAGCTVLLDGQFGNITVSFGDMYTYLYTKYKQHKWIPFLKAIRDYSKSHNYSFKSTLKYYIKSMLSDKTLNSYRRLRGRDIVNYENENLAAANPEFAAKCGVDERFKLLGLGKYLGRQDMDAVHKFLTKPIVYSQTGAIETKISLAHGITKRDPTRDKRIIEFCASLPAEQFVYKGQERSLIRRAMKGILPDEIRLNTISRGQQSADWVQRLRKDWSGASSKLRDTLEISEIKQYIDAEKVFKILEETWAAPKDEESPKIRMLIICLVFSSFINNMKD